MKQNNRIRLTESQLHKVIKESVRKILRENEGTKEDFAQKVDLLNQSVEGMTPFDKGFGKIATSQIEKLFPGAKPLSDEQSDHIAETQDLFGHAMKPIYEIAYGVILMINMKTFKFDFMELQDTL